MTIAEIIAALIAKLPDEYTAIMALVAQIRAALSLEDQAAVDAEVETGFSAEQIAMAKADAALAPT